MYKIWKKEEPYMVLENKIIRTPITEEKTKELKAGDYVNISGTIYVARDAAHKRMMQNLEEGKRSQEVVNGIIRNKAVYFAAVGGAGALLSKCIKSSRIVCYEEVTKEFCAL